MSEERVSNIVDLANSQKPDLTVLLGDYVCTHRIVSGYVPPGAWAEQLARLEPISAPPPALPWVLNVVWAIPTAGPIPLSTLPSGDVLNESTLPRSYPQRRASVAIKCMNQWTPVFENDGHECLVAWTNASNIAYPVEPSLDGSAGPGDNWSIAQHNLGVLPVGSSKRHLIKYAFQVCNGADEERGFMVAARQAPLEEIEAFLPGVPGGRAILDKPGKVERPGIVASADPSAAELEQARPN